MVHGHFRGKGGLRQGDPLSPYLFVIALNCLSLLLDKAAGESRFNYRFNCDKTKLTHLCFADDLLIFIDGSLSSVQAVLQVLREFELLSGLAVSVHKTCFFSSGLSLTENMLISFSSGMTRGSFPMKYLGLPLCTKKLPVANCAPLIQQIKERISTWSARSLSFAGRLLLLNTVIAGITNFWCSTFLIPKSCINAINSACNSYLWKGSLEGQYSARVSWETITHSKDEGGLGIKDLLLWNRACSLKLIWLLFFRAGSVWVAWYREVILHGSLNNFWILKTSKRNSWLANKILKIRDMAYNWIKLRIGNGKNCRFWTDNWSPFWEPSSIPGLGIII